MIRSRHWPIRRLYSVQNRKNLERREIFQNFIEWTFETMLKHSILFSYCRCQTSSVSPRAHQLNVWHQKYESKKECFCGTEPQVRFFFTKDRIRNLVPERWYRVMFNCRKVHPGLCRELRRVPEGSQCGIPAQKGIVCVQRETATHTHLMRERKR